MTNIRLPRSFASLANQSWSPAIERYGAKEVKIKNNEYLSLSSGMMRRLFTPVVDCIKEHLKTLKKKPQLLKVKTMLFVGGFSESPFLQEEVKREFSGKCRVLIPKHASIAVVQGAVMFGKMPTKITQRVVSTTYGVRCRNRFIPGIHPEEKLIITDGEEFCTDIFDCLAKENKIVRLGEKIKKIYLPNNASASSVSIEFYITSNPETKFTTDPGVNRIGLVLVQSPHTHKGYNRNIEVSMYFGGTEITATAHDLSSGNKAETTLEFFSQS